MSLSVFASQALADFQSTAAIAPSSKFLAEAMAEPLPLARADVVLEFGPGTGVMTRELLDAMPRTAKLLAFEVNPKFVEFLRRRVHDPRLEVIPCGAEEACHEMRRRGYRRADAVLSSLGLTMMGEQFVAKLFRELRPVLDSGSVFTQFQYVHRVHLEDGRPVYCDVRQILRRHFQSVDRRMIVRNLPPAFVYECRLPR